MNAGIADHMRTIEEIIALTENKIFRFQIGPLSEFRPSDMTTSEVLI